MARASLAFVLVGGCVAGYGPGNHDGAYYGPCYDDTFCVAGLACDFPMCSQRCTGTRACSDRFGAPSYCSVDGWCRSSCAVLADCPANTDACMEGTCVARGLGL